MSRYIATRAIRGANLIVGEAEALLNKALAEHGPATPVAFPNTAYYLPVILGMTGREVTQLGELEPVLAHAKDLLHPVPTSQCWTPYLGETLDSGMATLLAAEIIEAVRFIYGEEPQQIAGLHAGGSFTSPDGRQWRRQWRRAISTVPLTTSSSAPGASSSWMAACPASRPSSAAPRATRSPSSIVRELQRRNILIFLCRATSTGARSSTSFRRKG